MESFATTSLSFLLGFSGLFIFLISVHADHLAANCSGGRSYIPGSTFESNLRNLLSSLSTEAQANGFSNKSTGEHPDQVYGLVLCRGDIDISICKSNCLDQAIYEVIEHCPNRTEAVIWYKECMIRYSDHDFFGTVDISSRVLLWSVDRNSSETDVREVNGQPMMYGLVDKTSVSPKMFEVDSAPFGKWGTRYGLMQCTRDLSRDGCKRCLGDLMKDFERCCVGTKKWRILASSCDIRYDDYRFYLGELGPAAASQGRSRRLKFVIITSSSLLVSLVIMGLCIYYWRCRRKRLHMLQKEKQKEQMQEFKSNDLGLQTNTTISFANMQKENQEKTHDLPLIDFCTLESATDNFSHKNKLGEGGFGSVYKGILPDGKEIAVKRLSRSSVQGLEEFKNEITFIANLQHRNLVKILFCCIEREEKLIIYEYMPNTSLDAFLFDETRRAQLDWRRRRNIIVGIARGLLYLHEDSRLRIIHRDLKPSNVLLDKEMNPKISDFGLARMFGGNESETNTIRIVGTYGYMAPEYAMEGLFSVKSDVFSFGVILLEILSGKKNNRFFTMGNAQSLLTYAWQLWKEGQGLDLLDPLLVEPCPTSEVLRLIHIGLLCVQEDAVDRPTMSSVVIMLGSESVSLRQPTQPAFSVGRGVLSSGQYSSSALTCSVNEITVSTLDAR